jgi:hypothetical protein
MIHLTMTPEVSSIRAYDQPGGYENRRPYLAIVTVTHLNDTTVYLHSGVGTVDRETWVKVLDLLRSQGVTTLMMERHGEMKTIALQQGGAHHEPITNIPRAA